MREIITAKSGIESHAKNSVPKSERMPSILAPYAKNKKINKYGTAISGVIDNIFIKILCENYTKKGLKNGK